MIGREIVAEINLLADKTWDSKVANIVRLLDDNNYAGLYSYVHVADLMQITFAAPQFKVFNIDLSSDITHRKVLDTIDDYFGEFEHDRSYKRDDSQDIKVP